MARTDDLNVWRIFCEVVQAGGVNAACDVLECEPSTVSRALKAIETEIGAPIFLREGRHLKLTELGARAYDKAIKLLNVHELMIQDLTCKSSKDHSKPRNEVDTSLKSPV